MATITEMLIQYGKDAKNRKLQSYYMRKSYMEKLGIARAEEPHSAFWANLFRADDINCDRSESPLMWFLQVLVNRECTATATAPGYINSDLKRAIISRNLDFHIEIVKSEMKIKEVCGTYFSKKWPSVSSSCEDELDIYIKCKIYGIPSIDELEIIVENKVTSNENGPKSKVVFNGYDDKNQTDRYYNACKSTCNKKKVQLFVFLTPDEVGPVTTATNKNFIQISYQDLLDTILIPLIDSDSLLPRQRFELEDYIDVLNMPTLDVKQSKRIVMARSKDQERDLIEYGKKNEDLLIQAMIAKAKKDKKSLSLTLDDQLLVDFIEKNLNVLHALKSVGGLDLVTNLTSSDFLIKVASNYKKVNQSNLAIEFAKYHYSNTTRKLIQDLNKDFKCIKINLWATCQEYKQNTTFPINAMIDTGIYFQNNCWGKGFYLPLLIDFIKKNYSGCFDIIV